MKTSLGRRAEAVVGRAVDAARLPLQPVKAGCWSADRGQVQWSVDVLHEPPYGTGVFRVGWGILAPGAAAIAEREEGPGSLDATVGGDAGSFATGSRRIRLLCVEGSSIGLGHRLLWGVRPEPDAVLVERIAQWLAGPITGLFMSMTSRQEIIQFIENNIVLRHIGRETHPLTAEQGLSLTAALRALGGDKDGAYADLERWRTMLGTPEGFSYKAIAKRIENIRRRIERL